MRPVDGFLSLRYNSTNSKLHFHIFKDRGKKPVPHLVPAASGLSSVWIPSQVLAQIASVSPNRMFKTY